MTIFEDLEILRKKKQSTSPRHVSNLKKLI